jgi:hypothetical protein
LKPNEECEDSKRIFALFAIQSFLENPFDEQQQTHDRERYPNDGADKRQADQDSNEHEHDTNDHRDEAARQFDDNRQQFPDRDERPEIPWGMMSCMCCHFILTSKSKISAR